MSVKQREIETKYLQIMFRWERINLESYPTFVHYSSYIVIFFHCSHVC